MAHELIAKDFDGNVHSLGVFGDEEFAARVHHYYRTECGDEYFAFRIRETDDETIVFEDPGPPSVDEDLELLNSAGVHIATHGKSAEFSDETIAAMAAVVRCVRAADND